MPLYYNRTSCNATKRTIVSFEIDRLLCDSWRGQIKFDRNSVYRAEKLVALSSTRLSVSWQIDGTFGLAQLDRVPKLVSCGYKFLWRLCGQRWECVGTLCRIFISYKDGLNQKNAWQMRTTIDMPVIAHSIKNRTFNETPVQQPSRSVALLQYFVKEMNPKLSLI